LGTLWDNIWVRFITVLGLSALLLWLCYELRQILIPLALAFIVAYIFHPAVDFLERHKIPRAITIAVLLLLILAVFATTLLVVIPRLIRQSVDFVQSFQNSFPEIQQDLQSAVGRFGGSQLAERFSSNLDELLGALRSHLPQVLESIRTILVSIITHTFGLIGAIANFLLFAVVSVYLLNDFNRIIAKAEGLIPLTRKESFLGIMKKIDANLKSFFRGQLITCTILAIIYSVGLSIVGVPFALLIGILGGYGQIVPYMGTALAVVPAVLLALIEFGDFVHPLLAAMVFVVGQTLEGFVITPKIMGQTVGLHPVVIILAILVFGTLLGFLGILVAVPLAAVLKVVLGEAVARYKRSGLFSA
jgi:predicted PurR-regulated permease PerM